MALSDEDRSWIQQDSKAFANGYRQYLENTNAIKDVDKAVDFLERTLREAMNTYVEDISNIPGVEHRKYLWVVYRNAFRSGMQYQIKINFKNQGALDAYLEQTGQ